MVEKAPKKKNIRNKEYNERKKERALWRRLLRRKKK
jgi:hypothetical protein